MTANEIICPFCGIVPTKDTHTRRWVCKCRRLHEYNDFDGKTYSVLIRKDGKKEVIKHDR